MFKVVIQLCFLLIFSFLCASEVFGQPVLPSDLKKPKKYENKKLGAEKSAEKKFRGPRKFIQNTVTHYNWFFNANNKLNQVLEAAKLSHRDDFTKLLPFYNYSLEQTSANRTELDSVIYKANTGILTHDLRNAWIDNLYMLIGKSYYFRNDLDSAYLTFQYINYAFSPKEEDGYDMPIGSNANEGTNALSVSTKEKNNIVRNALSTPPSRNESFIWQIRTYILNNRMPEAASLIETLKNDPNFPGRLETDLNEAQALWFYQQNVYDSAAFYLEHALPNANDRVEASRWEYLIAQLYERAGNRIQAQDFYRRAQKRTLDPVLEVHAILNGIRQDKSDSITIRRNIESLKKMARKDVYQRYRDVIYFAAAQIEAEQNNIGAAKDLLLKSARASANSENPEQRTLSFLMLGDLSFQEKNFPDAKRYYDSINSSDPGVTDPIVLDARKDMVQQLVAHMEVIQRQDSLQALAQLPEAERYALLKKIARQMRKIRGLKEEDEVNVNAAVGMGNSNRPPPDLFDSNNKGEWYFNNPSLKSKGFTAFRQTWGNRPNADNWRRATSISQNPSAGRQTGPPLPADPSASTAEETEDPFSVATLLKGIPLTAEQVQVSDDSIANAMVEMGILYTDKLEDFAVAIDTLENYTGRFTYHNRMEDALYYLYIAHRQLGNADAAAAAKALLDQKFAGTRAQQLVNNSVTGEADKYRDQITKQYDDIYNLFIEGEFQEALARKKINDSLHGNSYWTPQLLYIESVYFVHSREDDRAKQVLQSIIDQFPNEPMAGKAQIMLDVLGRRREIEDYLTKLQIKRIEDTVFLANAPAKPREQIGTPMEQDTTRMLPLKKPVLITDTATDRPVISAPDIAIRPDTAAAVEASAFTFSVEAPHTVAIVLNKVDPVYVTESRNAFNRYNQANFYNRTISISNVVLNDTTRLVVMSGFENAPAAMEYFKKVQPVAGTQIIPWMPAGKYSFILISEHNIQVLQNNQDLQGYLRFQERYGIK